MDIINGYCVLCDDNKLVLTNKGKNATLDLLKNHYFEVNEISFTEFFKLFTVKKIDNSICLNCAYRIECYVTTRNAAGQTNKNKDFSKTCSICFSTTNVTKGSSALKEDMIYMLKDIKKQPRVSTVCLRCCFAVESFKHLRDSINKLLEQQDSDDDTNTSYSSEVEMKPLIKKPGLKNKKNVSFKKPTIQTRGSLESDKNLRKRKISSQENQVSTPPKKAKINTPAKKAKGKSKDLDHQLKHLSTVNKETIERDMQLSYNVITDQKMMFDIPFIRCAPTKIKKKIRVARSPSIGRRTKRNVEVIGETIDISSDNESVSDIKTSKVFTSPRQLRKKSSSPLKPINGKKQILKSPKKKMIPSSDKMKLKSSPDKMKLKPSPVKKKIIPSPAKKPKITYNCKECNKLYKMKYMLVLHELEHEASYSPMINAEFINLVELKQKMKDNPKEETSSLQEEKVDDKMEVNTSEDVAEETTAVSELPKKDDIVSDEKDKNEDENVSDEKDKNDVENVSDEKDKNEEENVSDDKEENVTVEKDKNEDDNVTDEKDKNEDDNVTDEKDKNKDDNVADGKEKIDESEKIDDSAKTDVSEKETDSKMEESKKDEDTSAKVEEDKCSEISDADTEILSTVDDNNKQDDASENTDNKDTEEIKDATEDKSIEEDTEKMETEDNVKEIEVTETEKEVENGDSDKDGEKEKEKESNESEEKDENIIEDNVEEKENPKLEEKISTENVSNTVETATDKNAVVTISSEEENSVEGNTETDKNAEKSESTKESKPDDNSNEPKKDDQISLISSDNESNTENNEHTFIETHNSEGSENEDSQKEKKSNTEETNGHDSNNKEKSTLNDSNEMENEDFSLKLSSGSDTNSPIKSNSQDADVEECEKSPIKNNSQEPEPEKCENQSQKSKNGVGQDTFEMVENLLTNLGA